MPQTGYPPAKKRNYATTFSETMCLEAYLDSFPNPSPLMFQNSIHPSGLEQVLIARQMPVSEFLPFAGRRHVMHAALIAACTTDKARQWVVASEEQGTWLTEKECGSPTADSRLRRRSDYPQGAIKKKSQGSRGVTTGGQTYMSLSTFTLFQHDRTAQGFILLCSLGASDRMDRVRRHPPPAPEQAQPPALRGGFPNSLVLGLDTPPPLKPRIKEASGVVCVLDAKASNALPETTWREMSRTGTHVRERWKLPFPRFCVYVCDRVRRHSASGSVPWQEGPEDALHNSAARQDTVLISCFTWVHSDLRVFSTRSAGSDPHAG